MVLFADVLWVVLTFDLWLFIGFVGLFSCLWVVCVIVVGGVVCEFWFIVYLMLYEVGDDYLGGYIVGNNCYA